MAEFPLVRERQTKPESYDVIVFQRDGKTTLFAKH